MKSPVLLLLPHAAYAGCKVDKVNCYVDDSARILEPTEKAGGSPLNLEYCAQLCANENKSLAGVENGGQCFCGNSIRSGAKTAPDSDCNMDCKADGATEKCGGSYRIGVFDVSCSGDPEPEPKSVSKLHNPCLDPAEGFASMPWCNSALPIDQRVDDMISRMTTAEKICSLDSGACAVESLGLREYNWWSEATHGISHVSNNKETPYETNFAFPITTAMSFNRSLWHVTGQRIGIEARAFMNAGNAYSTYWAPVINLAREPRWGRNLETPGEDPYLSGEYATQFVQGLERHPEDKEHIQASACCKHYVGNEMEGSTVAGTHWDRKHFDATISQQDLTDSYMPPFQACVEKGKVTGLMCSYNSVNGVPSCANDWLLQEMARDTWKFDGYITSDCDADDDVFSSHHFTSTPEEAVKDVLRAGTDIDCGRFVAKHAQSALDKGVITEQDLDDRLKLAFRMRMRLSHFDPKGVLDNIPASEACSAASQEAAREGVVQSTTMLKNTGVLPLDTSKVGKVAVIGPLSDFSKEIAGYYGGNNCDDQYWTLIDAVKQYAPNTVNMRGVDSVTTDDTSGIADAVKMASEADVVVLAIGTDLTIGREGSDAASVVLSAAQQELVDRVSAAATGPVIVAKFSHNPVDMSAILSNDKIGAVLYLGQPSVQVIGVGDVLFGKRSPAGRMITTIYPASYGDQISIFDFNMRPGPSAWPRTDCPKPYDSCQNGTNPGRTHKFFNGDAVVPFGFGLSYSSWEYKVLESPSVVSLDGLAGQLEQSSYISMMQPVGPFHVEVTNTGSEDADDVVLAFAAAPGAGSDGLPIQELIGFERVHVKAGEKAMVTVQPELSMFSQVDENGNRYPLSGEYKVWFGVKATESLGMGYAETTVQATTSAIVL